MVVEKMVYPGVLSSKNSNHAFCSDEYLAAQFYSVSVHVIVTLLQLNGVILSNHVALKNNDAH